jgi:hypothetical protein
MSSMWVGVWKVQGASVMACHFQAALFCSLLTAEAHLEWRSNHFSVVFGMLLAFLPQRSFLMVITEL